MPLNRSLLHLCLLRELSVVKKGQNEASSALKAILGWLAIANPIILIFLILIISPPNRAIVFVGVSVCLSVR